MERDVERSLILPLGESRIFDVENIADMILKIARKIPRSTLDPLSRGR
jgi:hypothetical protein